MAGAATNQAVHAQAQQAGVCKGIVKDSAGEPLIGASVVVKGSKTGTVTGIDGDFVLDKVNKGDVLVISYLGYNAVEVKWNGQPLNVTMNSDAQALDELVVVGYGVQKKSSMTASVTTVSQKEIQKQVTSNVATALQGRAPGVEVLRRSRALQVR